MAPKIIFFELIVIIISMMIGVKNPVEAILAFTAINSGGFIWYILDRGLEERKLAVIKKKEKFMMFLL